MTSDFYSSFNTSGRSTLPTAARPLWNSSVFLPSKYQPPGPTPTSYSPKFPEEKKRFFISKSEQRPVGMLHGEDTPGPGAYQPEPHRAQQPRHTGSLPSLRSSALQKQSPTSASLRDLGPLRLDAGPGPQQYSPNYDAVAPRSQRSVMSKTSRFSDHPPTNSPGPGHYASGGSLNRPRPAVVIGQTKRRIQESVADFKDLRQERKLPGPGDYAPLLDAKGHPFDAFPLDPIPYLLHGSAVGS
eukprot:GGOE01005673.1.p1 GENE.GGOE01005673.1~~GGOE01005673.1.p1  ORF type:complete len:242 (+),score=62.68 GGOE01005673.1:48-773(+)